MEWCTRATEPRMATPIRTVTSARFMVRFYRELNRKYGGREMKRLALVALIVLVPLTVSAHHGWGGNATEETTITGTVETPVSLSGPHATMRIRSGGQVWDITMAPPARTSAAGLKEGVIPVG